MDIYCIRCGEPWDAWGAQHGDMLEWEWQLFRAGAGCPACEGIDNGFTPTRLEHVEMGDDDPGIRINQMDDKLDGCLPEWKRPDDKIFWTCGTCGVQVIGVVDYKPDHEEYITYHLPPGAPGSQWYHSHAYDTGMPEKEPAHMFGDTPVCEFCLQHCGACGAPVCSLLETGDVYDEGWCATPAEYINGMHSDVYCITCIESMCSECGGLPDDCTCVRCDCGEHLGTDEYNLPDTCPSCGAHITCDDEEDTNEDTEEMTNA